MSAQPWQMQIWGIFLQIIMHLSKNVCQDVRNSNHTHVWSSMLLTMSVSSGSLCKTWQNNKPTHTRPSLSRLNGFDLCSEETRLSVLDVTGWHITWIRANKRGRVGEKYQAFTESFFKMEQWLRPGGKRSDPAGMFILDRKEAVIVIVGDFLSAQHSDSSLYLNNNSLYVWVECHGWCTCVNIFLHTEKRGGDSHTSSGSVNSVPLSWRWWIKKRLFISVPLRNELHLHIFSLLSALGNMCRGSFDGIGMRSGCSCTDREPFSVENRLWGK